jgi:hypothetical protein
VLAELRAEHSPGFGHNMGERWAVGLATRKRFEALMELNYGVRAEGPTSVRNPIIYADACKDNT